jgi:selenoprotein W-related protein
VGAEIEAETGVRPELVEGGGGVFDVTVDGERLFSKRYEGRFPEPGEVAALLRQR